MSTHSEIAIRTTNWNRMNFFRRTTRNESLSECLMRRRGQEKIRIVQRNLKKFPETVQLFDRNRQVVVVSKRRFGKATLYRLFTEFISLKELELALASRDRGQIAKAIHKRINARGMK